MTAMAVYGDIGLAPPCRRLPLHRVRLTRTSSYLQSRRGGTDTRVIPRHLVEDPTFIPRLTWRTTPRIAASDVDIPGTIRQQAAAGYAVFCDSSFFDDRRDPAVVGALLDGEGSLYLTPEVRQELEPWLKPRPDHPLAVALARADPAIVNVTVPEAGSAGRHAFDYYTTLLKGRRRAVLAVLLRMSNENGLPPDQQAPTAVRARLQKDYGERGRLLATKRGGPLYTDEGLVYLAVAHALRTGTPTTILSNDADVEEQFFKLLWLLNTDYRSMLAAQHYYRDPGAYRLIAPTRKAIEHPASPVEAPGAVLIAGWQGRHLDSVLPASPRFVPVTCLNGRDTVTQMTFGGEQEMADVLAVKDLTKGLSTDLLGERNLHALVPPNFIPAGEDQPCVLVAKDRRIPVTDSEVAIPALDVHFALHNHERPRTVAMVPEGPPSSALLIPRSRLTLGSVV